MNYSLVMMPVLPFVSLAIVVELVVDVPVQCLRPE